MPPWIERTMSRIGNKPVVVPEGVDVTVQGCAVTVKGKHGELSWECPAMIAITYDEGTRELRVSRPDDVRQNRAYHGLTRSLINNMVQGIVQPYEKKLEIVGVGYGAVLTGKTLNLSVGFANTVVVKVPDIVICEVPDQTHVVVRSPDKQAVGQLAAEIRAVRPPEPYKGKGIRYDGEHVRRKAGKAFAS